MTGLEVFLQWVVAPAVLAGGTWMAARYTAKNATQAASHTARVAERATQVQERATEIDGLDRLVQRLEKRLEQQEQQSMRQQEDGRSCLDKITALEGKVRTLEASQRADKMMIRHLVTYARMLRDALIKSGGVVPESPAGLDIDRGFAS